MNIFIFDENFELNAKAHPDKLIVKMPLELSQIVATVLSERGLQLLRLDGEPYGITHKNHPCTNWARANATNLAYTIRLGLALCNEYEQRYGKQHGCYSVLHKAETYCNIADVDPQNFIVCINEQYVHMFVQDGLISEELGKAIIAREYVALDTAVLCYRAYLRYAKAHYAEWRHSEVPAWWPRQDGCGRLYCKHKYETASNECAYYVPPADKHELESEVLDYCTQVATQLGKRKIARSKLIALYLEYDRDCAKCKAFIDAYYAGKAQLKQAKAPKPKQHKQKATTTTTTATIELLLASPLLDTDPRELIKQYLGTKVPTNRTIARWQAEHEDRAAFAERIFEHITYWARG